MHLGETKEHGTTLLKPMCIPSLGLRISSQAVQHAHSDRHDLSRDSI